MTRLPAGADLLPQAGHRAERPSRGRRAARGLQVAELRGRDRHRDRPHLPQRRPRRGRRLHRRLHDRQRLRPARLPGHRRRLDAAGQGLATRSCPLGPGLVDRLGLPRQDDPHAASTGRCKQDGNTDEMGGTCTTSSPTSPAPSRCCPATCCSPGRPRTPGRSTRATSSRSRSRGSARLTQPHRHRADADPRRRRRPADRERGSASRPRSAATGSSAASGHRPRDLYPSTVTPRSSVEYAIGVTIHCDLPATEEILTVIRAKRLTNNIMGADSSKEAAMDEHH